MTDVTPPSGPPGRSGDRAAAGDELTPEELACGYLDGELEADERARVEADPALLALVAELRAVSDAVAAPVAPLTDEQRSAMVAAAMGTIPAVGAGGSDADIGEPGAAAVASLDAARARRSARLVRTVAGGLAAVAAVGLVALVVTRGGGSSNENTTADAGAATAALEAAAGGGAADTTSADVGAAQAAADTTAAAAEAPATEAPASEAPAGATGGTTTAPAMSTAADAGAERPVPDLGPLATRREATSATTGFVSVVPPPDSTGPCADYPAPVATATFQGKPAYVVIIEVAPEGNRLAFLDQTTCAVLVKVDPANA
jgi:hypothetical protein